MLEYQKTPLSAPILETINPKFKKLAVKSFKSILKIMSSVEVQPVFSEFASLLETGIRNGGLRDEILIQMCSSNMLALYWLYLIVWLINSEKIWT